MGRLPRPGSDLTFEGDEEPFDPARLDPDRCGDSDTDGCDDCAVGSDGFGPLSDRLPASDGPDADGDGALSFEEVAAIHKRIFDGVDADRDGKVTPEEVQAFVRE